MSDYEGLDEDALKELLENATNYDERSALRKAIRKLKNAGIDNKKKFGSANYRRAGYQAPKTMLIPNSVTGNVLPNKVTTDNLSKVEVPKDMATISYLKTNKNKSASSPRESVSSEPGRKDSLNEDIEGSSVQSSIVNVTETPSPLPPASRTRVNGGAGNISPEELLPAASPEPREPTPPPREPTPPPREPTPPPREPTPPPREPTPPPKEPTPPPKEPTPEPSPEPEEEIELEEDVKEEVDAEEEEEEDVEEEEDDDVPLEGVRVKYEDSDEDEDRNYSPSLHKQKHEYRPIKSAPKAEPSTVVPLDVTKKEEGIEDGNFLKKLQKTTATKIDTTSAFPQAKPKGEQVDFRNVLRKKGGNGEKAKAVNTRAAFPQAKQKGEQVDFRNILRKVDSKEPQRSNEEEEEEVLSPEPTEERYDDDQEEEELSEAALGGRQGEEEEEEEEIEDSRDNGVPEEETNEEVDGALQVSKESIPPPQQQEEEEEEEMSYEARQAERRRRREERKKELEAVANDTKPVQNGQSSSPGEVLSPPPPTANPSSPTSNGTADPDSYEARREARRKAREERLKVASARVSEDKTGKMSYKEKKALEIRKQAKENRKQWENREEDSGAKAEAKPANFKKKDSATQQLLAWCQHKTKYYENVNIKDFRSSWADGLAFCAIMHSFLPDKIPYDELTPEDRRKNFTLAFSAAIDAGIPEMLDVDDMVDINVPDAKSIMTFLVTIYQHFNS